MTTTRLIFEAIWILGFVANVWANLLIAQKSETGWIVRLVANVLWLAYGIVVVSLANILSSVTFAAINVYGLRRWKRERLSASSRIVRGMKAVIPSETPGIPPCIVKWTGREGFRVNSKSYCGQVASAADGVTQVPDHVKCCAACEHAADKEFPK